MSCFAWSEPKALPDKRNAHPGEKNPQHKGAKEEGKADPGTCKTNG